MPSWRATLDDGTLISEGPARYAELDRDRVVRFEVYLEPVDLAPAITIDVARGRRLIHRRRVWPKEGEVVMMVGTESEDRSDIDIELLRLSDGVRGRLVSYGTGAVDGAPVLFDFETVRG